MKPPKRIKSVSKRMAEKRKELEKLNAFVWVRDDHRCILCHSKDIYGEPLKSGAHHCLSRGSHPELFTDIRNLALLCRRHHDQNANTKKVVREILHKLKRLYGYDYSEIPYREYFDD
jgi:hypothetical protein